MPPFYSLTETDHPEGRPWVDAAVLVLTFEKNGEGHLVLNKRTEEVLHHKGQVCFPGGMRDAEDKSLWETALRETQEELGVDPERVTLVRELGQQYTPTGYRVTPYLARLKNAEEAWKTNPNEIAEVFSVPFSFFRNRENLKIRTRHLMGHDFLDPLFIYEGHEIWGMTGRVVCEIFGIHPED